MSNTAGSGSYSISMARTAAVGDLQAGRGDGRDRLAAEAHDVRREDRPVLDRRAEQDLRDVLRRQDRAHAGQRHAPS